MNKKYENIIQNEVQETLDQLDGQERRTTDEFFYTRLMAKMESSGKAYKKKLTLAIVYPLILIVVMFVNYYSISGYTGKKQKREISREEMLDHVAEDYNITVCSYYIMNDR